MAQRHISVPKPFASGDATEWFKRFEICCKTNEWNSATIALKLPTLLEGEALAVWLELSEEQQADYETAKKEISATLIPMEFVSLDEFHRRALRPGEALAMFVHELKKLLDQSMPGLETRAHEQLLLHQFLSGLPEMVSRQLRATGEVKELDTAITRARLIMAVDDSGRSAAVKEKSSEVDTLKEQIAQLTEQVAALSTTPTRRTPKEQQRHQAPRRCFNCNQTGHLMRDCRNRLRRFPDTRRCFNCNQPGHLAKDCYQGNGTGASSPA